MAGDPVVSYGQEHRATLIAKFGLDDSVVIARKTARVLAKQLHAEFVVNTDRGPMRGHAGDWLITNLDDTGSDLWSISDERFQATYVVHGSRASVVDHIRAAIELLRDPATDRGRDRHDSLAITELEDALLRVTHGTELQDARH